MQSEQAEWLATVWATVVCPSQFWGCMLPLDELSEIIVPAAVRAEYV